MVCIFVCSVPVRAHLGRILCLQGRPCQPDPPPPSPTASGPPSARVTSPTDAGCSPPSSATTTRRLGAAAARALVANQGVCQIRRRRDAAGDVLVLSRKAATVRATPCRAMFRIARRAATESNGRPIATCLRSECGPAEAVSGPDLSWRGQSPSARQLARLPAKYRDRWSVLPRPGPGRRGDGLRVRSICYGQLDGAR